VFTVQCIPKEVHSVCGRFDVSVVDLRVRHGTGRDALIDYEFRGQLS
jgi:hypothetical protein